MVANDGISDSDPATATLTPFKDPATVYANNDEYATGIDIPITIPASEGVLTNDESGGGQDVTASDTNTTGGGTVTVNSDGSFTYQPASGFSGVDTFTYTATDKVSGNTDTATVQVIVAGDPDAVNDYYGTDSDSPLNFNVLDNDAVVDPTQVTVELVPGTTAHDGGTWDGTDTKQPVLTVNPDGTVSWRLIRLKQSLTRVFTPLTTLTDPITGKTDTATATVVVSQPDRPSGIPDFETTTDDIPVAIDVTANDYSEDTTGPDGEPAWTKLDLRSDPVDSTGTVQGIATVNPGPDGTLETADDYIDYDPPAGFTGDVTFTYRVEDDNGRTEETTVTVTVEPPLDEQPDTKNDH